MPSFARTLGLMLIFAGPLGLAAQTLTSGARPPVQPGIPPATPLPPWDRRTDLPTPTTGPVRPNSLPGRVAPASYQASVSSQNDAVQNDAVQNDAVQNDAVQNDPVQTPAPGNNPSAPSSGQTSLSGTATPLSLSPPKSRPGLKLRRPGQSERDNGTPENSGGLPSAVTVIGSLAVVLGIFLLVAWGMRRVSPAAMTALPGEVFEVLGRAPMANRQQAHLLRCGRKLLLVSVTATGTETLTEIVDPVEVDRLAGLCRQTQPGSATEAFRQVFQQFAPQRPDSGRLSRLFAPSGREDPVVDGNGGHTPAKGMEHHNA